MKVLILNYHKPSKNASLLDKFLIFCIKFWTFSKYYHTELVIGDKIVTSDFKKGVIFEAYDKIDTEIIEIIGLSINKNKLNNFNNFIEKQKNKKYDWVAIFLTHFLPLNYQTKKKWFCSEIVARSLIELGFNIKEKPYNITPKKIVKIIKKVRQTK